MFPELVSDACTVGDVECLVEYYDLPEFDFQNARPIQPVIMAIKSTMFYASELKLSKGMFA